MGIKEGGECNNGMKSYQSMAMVILPRFPVWLPPCGAVIIPGGYYLLANAADFSGRTGSMLTLLAFFMAMAVLTPYPFVYGKNREGLPWYPLAVAFFIALLLGGG